MSALGNMLLLILIRKKNSHGLSLILLGYKSGLENMMASILFQKQVSVSKTFFSDRTLRMGSQSQLLISAMQDFNII